MANANEYITPVQYLPDCMDFYAFLKMQRVLRDRKFVTCKHDLCIENGQLGWL